jgi:hypothetical protein
MDDPDDEDWQSEVSAGWLTLAGDFIPSEPTPQ